MIVISVIETLIAHGDGGATTLTAPAVAPAARPQVDGGTWALAHGPRDPGEARRIARGVLEEAWRVGGETVDAMLLVVSELVTNAVEHARPHLSLHLHREHADRRIWIWLTDGGPAAREGAWTGSCAADEHGRGMTVIAALSAAHGTRTHPDGRATHWACLRTSA